MQNHLAILFSLLHLVSLGSAAPMSTEVMKMKSKVKWMAEQLVIKLNKDFQVPTGFTLSPPTDELDGLTSIVTMLEGYNSVISDTLNGVPQIKTEISSLAGYLNQWKQGHCSVQKPKPLLPRPLQELQSRKEFVHTVSMEALMRLKDFLSLLQKNLDQLETC